MINYTAEISLVYAKVCDAAQELQDVAWALSGMRDHQDDMTDDMRETWEHYMSNYSGALGRIIRAQDDLRRLKAKRNEQRAQLKK